MFRFLSVLFLLALLVWNPLGHQAFAIIPPQDIEIEPTMHKYIICHTAVGLDLAGFKCLEGMFDGFIRTVIILIGIGLFLVIIYGGFRYITAGGDMKAIDTSRKILTYGFTGFGLAVSIYFIFAVLLKSLDLGNFLQFSIPCNEFVKNTYGPLMPAGFCP